MIKLKHWDTQHYFILCIIIIHHCSFYTLNIFSYWLVYHLIWSYIHSDNFQYISMFVPQIHLTPFEHVLLWTCTPVNMIWYVWYAQLEKHWYWPWWQHFNLSFEEYQILNFIISMQIKAFLNLPWKHYIDSKLTWTLD